MKRLVLVALLICGTTTAGCGSKAEARKRARSGPEPIVIPVQDAPRMPRGVIPLTRSPSARTPGG